MSVAACRAWRPSDVEEDYTRYLLNLTPLVKSFDNSVQAGNIDYTIMFHEYNGAYLHSLHRLLLRDHDLPMVEVPSQIHRFGALMVAFLVFFFFFSFSLFSLIFFWFTITSFFFAM